MKSSETRRYRMTARAKAAEKTGRAILEAAVALWRELPLDEVTLDAIARRAGVSVQTVIRRFGSKEGLLEAGIESDAAGVAAERDQVRAGDVEGALRNLLTHYEQDGDVVLRTLALEERIDAAKMVADNGRRFHRDWCTRVFGPFLPPPDSDSYTARLDAFVAATDLYLWKLLRRDLGRSAEETEETLRTILNGLIHLT